MEEIKFRYRFDRGKNFEKVMVGAGKRISTEIVTLDELENGEFIEYYSNYKILSRDRYTGIKDKNRKEIYNGDVVKIKGKKATVIFLEYAYGFGVDYGVSIEEKEQGYFNHQVFSSISITILMTLEIIGNIYENKNLL